MPIINMSKLIDKDLYAKLAVSGFQSDFKTVNYNFAKGAYIGKIYSWVTDKSNGKLYFMVYPTLKDFQTFNPTFLEINDNKLSILQLPQIIKDIEEEKRREKDAKDKKEKGVIGYYIEKYVPTVLFVSLAIYGYSKLRSNEK